MEINYQLLGARIRELRVSKKWTQAKLAEKSEIEPSNMSHIERAATKVSLPTLIRIANALEVTLDELVYGSLIKSGHVSMKVMDQLLADCTPEEVRALTEVVRTTKTVLRQMKRNED